MYIIHNKCRLYWNMRGTQIEIETSLKQRPKGVKLQHKAQGIHQTSLATRWGDTFKYGVTFTIATTIQPIFCYFLPVFSALLWFSKSPFPKLSSSWNLSSFFS